MLCDKKIPLRLKGKVYHTVVRLVLLYGAECWPVKKPQVERVMIVEMRMMRWMCGHMTLDRVRNVVIIDRVRVAPIGG